MGLGQVVNLASQNGQECTGGLNPTDMNIVLSEGFFEGESKSGINDNTDELELFRRKLRRWTNLVRR